jgi:hypothetical protein
MQRRTCELRISEGRSRVGTEETHCRFGTAGPLASPGRAATSALRRWLHQVLQG